MIHNNKVYANADDKFVKNTIVYANDGFVICHDATFTKTIHPSEIEDIFLNGMLIKTYVTEGYTTPASYMLSGDRVTIRGNNGMDYMTGLENE